VALTEIDRNLLLRCLGRKPGAWEDFVDRFMGLVVHVVNHTSQARSLRLSKEDLDDLYSEIFLAIVKDDFAVLRHFRGQSSLATYLTVIARRVCVREMIRRKMTGQAVGSAGSKGPEPEAKSDVERISNREEVERLMKALGGKEADVVRMYHLEGKTYREISSAVDIPENSIGPTLTRAREKMRSLK
jgi:RNA polymerase sigma-70 factor (ECF subfamily)